MFSLHFLSMLPDLPFEKINKYTVLNRLAEGGFGDVYLAETSSPLKELVVIKTQKTRTKSGFSLGVSHESTIINYLYGKLKSNRDSICPILWYGQHIPTKITCLIIPYYEMSLFDYIQQNQVATRQPNYQEWLKNTIDKISCSLECIHNQSVIHRDIRPQNIMLRRDMTPVLIDFGLSCFYVDENLRHVEMGELREEVIGSPKYASFYIHCGIKPSRRDDYISLAYIAICGAVNMNFIGEIAAAGESIPVSASVSDIANFPENHIEYSKNKMLRECKRRDQIIRFLSQYPENNWIILYIEWCYGLNYADNPAYSTSSNMRSSYV